MVDVNRDLGCQLHAHFVVASTMMWQRARKCVARTVEKLDTPKATVSVTRNVRNVEWQTTPQFSVGETRLAEDVE
jgi:hypothetical protein